MCGCCQRPASGKLSRSEAATNKKNEAQGPPQKWYSKLCKWKKEPPPPRLAQPMKAKGESFMSKLNCCKRKGKMSTRKPPPAPSRASSWRKLFCLDRACCAKCCARKTAPAEPPQGANRMEMKRSSSVAVPPKPTGLPKLDAALVEHTSVMKGAIPVLPICLAWMCLILNIVIPGSGTIISGLLCMCFGKPRFSVNDSGVARLGSLCVNFIVGISQIFTILFCLVGWGWSIWWGVIMIKVARKNRRIKIAEKATAAAGAAAPAPAATNQNHDVERGGGGG
uniref:Protein SPEC3 n=2 Tax=Lygus hesperus TaxID=30085 RepID=A0A146LY26_LYGHE